MGSNVELTSAESSSSRSSLSLPSSGAQFEGLIEESFLSSGSEVPILFRSSGPFGFLYFAIRFADLSSD